MKVESIVERYTFDEFYTSANLNPNGASAISNPSISRSIVGLLEGLLTMSSGMEYLSFSASVSLTYAVL